MKNYNRSKYIEVEYSADPYQRMCPNYGVFYAIFIEQEPGYELPLADTLAKCPICHSFVKEPIITECKHVFCEPCIKHWMKKEFYRTLEPSHCPMCRAVIEYFTRMATVVPEATITIYN